MIAWVVADGTTIDATVIAAAAAAGASQVVVGEPWVTLLGSPPPGAYTPPNPLGPPVKRSPWKTAVATPAALPTDDVDIGDVRVVLDDGDGRPAVYAWRGESWLKIVDPDAATGDDYAGIFAQAAAPTVSQIALNRWGYWDDTATGKLYTVRNRAGVLYSVELTTI